jgi:hypothetical protein
MVARVVLAEGRSELPGVAALVLLATWGGSGSKSPGRPARRWTGTDLLDVLEDGVARLASGGSGMAGDRAAAVAGRAGADAEPVEAASGGAKWVESK